MREVTTSDAVTVRASDSGPAPGATVVLLAGYTAPAASWALQVDALVAAPGTGWSPAPTCWC